MNQNTVTVMRFGEKPRTIDIRTLAQDFSGHGGGDNRLVEDLLDLIEGNGKGQALTSIDQSMESHYMAFAAEESRIHGGQVIDLMREA